MKKYKLKWIIAQVIVIVITVCAASECISNNDTTTVTPIDLKPLISAKSNGETLVLAAGTYRIGEEIDLNGNISISGAGSDQTIIESGVTGLAQQGLHFTLQPGSSMRITGVTFRGPGGTDRSNGIYFQGTNDLLRIDHCVFTKGGSHSFMIDGDIRGVIDHCSFVDDSQESISLRNTARQDAVWSEAAVLGTANAVFIEDCSFTFTTKGDHAVTAVNGARYVFRYNTISSSYALNATQVDTHGNYYNKRGGFSSEIYGNVMKSERSYYGIYLRGGRGVVFNNTLTGTYSLPICFTNDGSYIADTSTACGYHDCDYPAIDQINAMYVWNNTCNGAPVSVIVRDRGLDRTHIQKNRDYFESDDAGFNAYNLTYVPYQYPHHLVTE